MIDLCINAFGNFCNSSPLLHITTDSKVLWTGEIFGYQQIRCQIPTFKMITISGIGKVDGENGIYDTHIDEQGLILNDKYLRILDIVIAGISMEQQWINNLDLVSTDDSWKFQGATFWSNGRLCFDVHEPVLDWIIEKKYIQFAHEPKFRFDGKSGLDKFHYQPMIKQIEKIKLMLND